MLVWRKLLNQNADGDLLHRSESEARKGLHLNKPFSEVRQGGRGWVGESYNSDKPLAVLMDQLMSVLPEAVVWKKTEQWVEYRDRWMGGEYALIKKIYFTLPEGEVKFNTFPQAEGYRYTSQGRDISVRTNGVGNLLPLPNQAYPLYPMSPVELKALKDDEVSVYQCGYPVSVRTADNKGQKLPEGYCRDGSETIFPLTDVYRWQMPNNEFSGNIDDSMFDNWGNFCPPDEEEDATEAEDFETIS